ncbi:MAG: hypothetical protein IKK27_05630, partial [Alistipes sp.]|nr:hypothetical protein [Alistipes sp.]
CEDFEGKRKVAFKRGQRELAHFAERSNQKELNAKITLLDNFFYKKNGCVTKGAADQQSKNHILQKEYFLRI